MCKKMQFYFLKNIPSFFKSGFFFRWEHVFGSVPIDTDGCPLPSKICKTPDAFNNDGRALKNGS